MAYTHLQVKSGFSLMGSAITIPKLVEQANELQFEALALTDDEVMYGAIPFYRACTEKGIRPIIGMTVRLSDGNDSIIPVILLAKTNAGYHQLIRLSTKIQLEKIEGMELGEAKTFVKDLVCILPVSGSRLQDDFLETSHEDICQYLKRWKDIFGENDLYLGVKTSSSGGEETLNASVKAFSEAYQFQVTAINDVVYLKENDAIAFDCLQAMREGRKWSMTALEDKDRYLRPEAEMAQLFSDWPQVLETTCEIKDKCLVDLQFDERLLPSFPLPAGETADSFLESQCMEKVHSRYPVLTEEIKRRLSYELHIIQSMNFSDYFLIVADFIEYARTQNILVGPGRGSSAGSIVAYVLGITDVDPIKYGLLFERFLNPERLTMPDIDIDFSDLRRDEVIEYVRKKYGEMHVAQIITFGTFAARSLIRELIKTMEIDDQDAAFVLKEISQQPKDNIVDLMKASPELNTYVKSSRELKALFAVAVKLEGLPRHISTHAAGVVISEKPLVEHVPLTTGGADTHLTQYPMNDLEAVGILKMDFLGLRNLTLLEKVIRSIGFSTGRRISLEQIPDDDGITYELLRSGRTNGVFQLESQGMKQVLTRLRPTSFEDIVAVNALYRPGPMDFIPNYIARKHGKEKVVYPHPDLTPILGRTYGVLVYQEQIMQIAHQIAGFSLGEADILRRAVSKKIHGMMERQKQAFLAGCRKNGYSSEVAEEIFGWIVKFSNYGFPRSHAVAYSKIAYQLAYLKANYPADFFAELMSQSRNQQDKLQLYLQELREMNIELLAPDINLSIGRYTVESGKIRMGLHSIKGVGNNVITEIIRARKDGGKPYANLFDFCLRVSPKLVSRSAIENLILAGAFDSTYSNRASLLASIDQAMEQGELFREFNDQPSLFQDTIDLEASYEEMEDFSQVKKLADEKELLGMYISSHPLKEYRKLLRVNGYLTLQQATAAPGKKKKAAAVIQAVRTIRTKRGDRMAFLTVGDEQSEMEAVIFPDLFRDVNRFLKEEAIVFITGRIEERNGKLQWVLENMEVFTTEVLDATPKEQLFIRMAGSAGNKAMQVIKEISSRHPGGTAVIIYDSEQKRSYRLSEEYFLSPDRDALRALQQYFQKDNVVLKKA